MNTPFVLQAFALVLFVLAALNVPAPPRPQLGWAGLACWVASVMVKEWR